MLVPLSKRAHFQRKKSMSVVAKTQLESRLRPREGNPRALPLSPRVVARKRWVAQLGICHKQ
eukprot:12909326-Prorocentrum_lima.AAC.1